MRWSEARTGRVFVIRLETGDRLPDAMEQLAAARGVERGFLVVLGGAADGSRVVVGPEDGNALPPVPMIHALVGVHEIAGVGTIFPDAAGKPSVHLHAALGRGATAVAGCTRPGVDIWTVGEVVLVELLGTEARRETDPATGFSLLEP
ncbi:MAG TPA: PPC domain-containing DNA-binding protein [bacterium]